MQGSQQSDRPPSFASEDEEARYYLEFLRDGTADQKIQARERLGRIFENRGMLDEAVELYRANLEADGQNPERYRHLARVYREQGRADLADGVEAQARKELAASPGRRRWDSVRILGRWIPRRQVRLAKIVTAGTALVVAVVSFAANLISTYQFSQQFTASSRQPVQLSGSLNLVVAEFGEMDSQGQVRESREARRWSDWVYDAVADKAKEFNKAPPIPRYFIDVAGPEVVGKIADASLEERAAHAQTIAREMNADLVIYGYSKPGDDGSAFVAEVFISNRRLSEAEELSGYYSWGQPISASGNYGTNSVSRQRILDQLFARTTLLASFVHGLGYFTLQEYDLALQQFRATEPDRAWDECQCGEVLHLFMGNAAGKLRQLPAALASYEKALQQNPEYARARIGAAEVQYLTAAGGCRQGQADVEGLQRAMQAYRSALDARHQPAASDVATTVALRVGRVHLCLSQALAGDYWEDARREFEKVIAAYGDGANPRLRNRAAEAYGYLAQLAQPFVGAADPQADYRRAADLYRRAIALSTSPTSQAVFNSQLGTTLGRLGQYDEAERAFDEAVRLDPKNAPRFEDARKRMRDQKVA